MKTFYIQTFGCQMNVYDTQRITNMLLSMGWTSALDMPSADLIILNTCSVREKATNKVFSALGRIRKNKKPGALFGIVGCVARESGADAFRRIPELNFVLGPQTYHKLTDIINNPDARLLNIDLGGLEKFDELPRMTQTDAIAYIPIAEGCNHGCTYCIVPYTRGREVSRPITDIMRDVVNANNTGALEICFLGQNVNGYRYTDISGNKFTLSDIVIQTANIDAVYRIRFTSSYPTEMSDEIIDLFRNCPKLMPILHLPIQSGSNELLKKMNRSYTTQMYMEIIRNLRIARPEIQISSDFIVGFPGESDDDFNATMDIVRMGNFISSYSFKYSPRPNTLAEKMPDQVSPDIKRARLGVIDDALNDIARKFGESLIGTVLPCLCEGVDKTGNNLIFRTPYMQQCVVENSCGTQLKIANIKITAANKASLRGEIIV